MHNTHFVDDSGFNAQSVSTPADMLKVATLALQEPAFAAGVAMPDVTLPVAGQVSSYTPLVGTENVIGVKSGFTDAAGGCDILALHQVVAGQSVVVLAAVTGQQGADVLGVAGAAAHALAQSASAQIVAQKVLTAGEEVAKASTTTDWPATTWCRAKMSQPPAASVKRWQRRAPSARRSRW
jgi:D-alanyl-D-alanine carboxypeptidase (penicillin-binding protein 5/6)